MLDLGKIMVRISTDTSGLKKGEREVEESTHKIEKEFEKTNKEVQKFNININITNQVLNKVRKEMDKTTERVIVHKREIKSLNKNVNIFLKTYRALLSVFVASKITGFGRDILYLIDRFTEMNVQIAMSTKSLEDYNMVQKELLRISNNTGSALKTTVKLFRALSLNAKELKLNAKQMVAFTETIQQLGHLSGSNYDQLNRGLTQFSHGLAHGILRTVELNSLLDTIPEIAVAISKGMGISLKQLREMAMAGDVVSKDVFEAILKQTDEISKRANDLPITFTVAFQSLQNSFGTLLSKVDALLGGNGNLAKRFKQFSNFIENNMEPLSVKIAQSFTAVKNVLSEIWDFGASLIDLGYKMGVALTGGVWSDGMEMSGDNLLHLLNDISYGIGVLTASTNLAGDVMQPILENIVHAVKTATQNMIKLFNTGYESALTDRLKNVDSLASRIVDIQKKNVKHARLVAKFNGVELRDGETKEELANRIRDGINRELELLKEKNKIIEDMTRAEEDRHEKALNGYQSNEEAIDKYMKKLDELKDRQINNQKEIDDLVNKKIDVPTKPGTSGGLEDQFDHEMKRAEEVAKFRAKLDEQGLAKLTLNLQRMKAVKGEFIEDDLKSVQHQMDTLQTMGRAGFEFQKSVAITKAIMNAESAAISAYNWGMELGGEPLARTMQMLSYATTAVSIAKISSQKYKGGRAMGGSVAPNSMYRVNENGMEMLTVGGDSYLMTGNQNGHVTPANKIGGGEVTVNIHNVAGHTAEVSRSQDDNGLNIDVIIKAIEGNFINSVETGNGGFSRAIEERYGLSRSVGAV